MTKDSIERIVKTGTFGSDEGKLQVAEALYEGGV
jgi:hypothetical protein